MSYERHVSHLAELVIICFADVLFFIIIILVNFMVDL